MNISLISFLCLLFINTLFGYNTAIVFIHLGPKLPEYVETSLTQARLFNPDSQIYLIGNEAALSSFNLNNVILVTEESLPKSQEHKQFLQRCKYGKDLWRYSSERFLVLDDFLQQTKLQNVFHLENDVMLYADLNELMPIFETYPIGVTFDNDKRCIPGFLYFKNPQTMKKLAKYFATHFEEGSNDMKVIANFKMVYGDSFIRPLPIIFPAYYQIYPLVSTAGHVAKNPEFFARNFNAFKSIFDAAAIGQYLGGIDPNYHKNVEGFVNESCVFNPSLFTYEWIEDSLGRKVPFLLFQGERVRINNLHIHSKNLKKFQS